MAFHRQVHLDTDSCVHLLLSPVTFTCFIMLSVDLRPRCEHLLTSASSRSAVHSSVTTTGCSNVLATKSEAYAGIKTVKGSTAPVANCAAASLSNLCFMKSLCYHTTSPLNNWNLCCWSFLMTFNNVELMGLDAPALRMASSMPVIRSTQIRSDGRRRPFAH